MSNTNLDGQGLQKNFTFVAERQLGRESRDSSKQNSLTMPREGGEKMNALEISLALARIILLKVSECHA